MVNPQKEIQSLEAEISVLLQQRRGIINEMKRLEMRFQSLQAEISELKFRVSSERAKHREYLGAFRKAVTARRQAVEAISKLREQIRAKQVALKALEEQAPRTPLSKVEDELQAVERMIETRRLSREEEKRLVHRARTLAGQLKTVQFVMRAKAEFEETLQAFKQLRREVEELSSVLQRTGPEVTGVRERIKRMTSMLKQLRGEEAGVEADMTELAASFASITEKIGTLKSRKLEIIERVRMARHQESVSRRNLEFQAARENALDKARRGEKLSLSELKLIYGQQDEEP